MTLLLMKYAIIVGLFCALLPSTLAADDAHEATPPASAPDPCATVNAALKSSNCPWGQFAELYLGATVDFPTGLFVRKPVYPASANKVLVSDQGEMIVSVWSASTKMQLSPREAMTTDLYNSGLTSVTHRKATESGYTFAGKLGSRFLLKRRVFSKAKPRVVTTVCVTWSSKAADEWAELASAISQTLKPGNGQVNAPATSKQVPEGRIVNCLGL